jgi:N-acetyl-D-muramate 6-phosphate phosphatase
MIRAVLFDLDGTFADTAPDLGYAVNQMRIARGLLPVPDEKTRPVTSSGARGLLGAGFGITPDHPDYAAMHDEFLNIYEANLCRDTRLFDGMANLVDTLEARRIVWGIVTNKAERFALPLMKLLGYSQRAACIIGGDTTGKLKPHPEPLYAAAKAINIDTEHCLYVGDDERDIQAGRAAGMKTVAVRFGYLNGSDPSAWGADAVINTPLETLDLLTDG